VTTWYVIDTRTDEIINAITTTSGAKPDIDPKRWESAEHLRLDANPPLSMLRNYRYWDERP
jgi:hypothetical protein